MSKPSSALPISRQLIRPSKMQAWVFVVGCGLSSMSGAFATALLSRPTSPCELAHSVTPYSEEYPSKSCHSLDIHSRMERETAKQWFTSTGPGAAREARLSPAPLGSGLVGITISEIQEGSQYENVGLKDGDTIATVEGIHLFSSNSDRLLRDKFLSNETTSISMALLRDGCPATLEIGLL